MGMLLDKVAQGIEKVVNPLASFINRIGAALILVIVLSISADVCLRYLLNHPIPGIVELTEFVLPLVVFLTVAYAAVEQRHVGIDILYERFGTKSRAVVDVFTSILSVYVMSILAWQLYSYGLQQFGTGERGDILGLPHWPAILVSAFGCLVMVVVLLARALRAVSRVTKSSQAGLLWAGVAAAAGLVSIGLPWSMNVFNVDISNLAAGSAFCRSDDGADAPEDAHSLLHGFYRTAGALVFEGDSKHPAAVIFRSLDGGKRLEFRCNTGIYFDGNVCFPLWNQQGSV